MLTFEQLNRILESRENSTWHKRLFTKSEYFTLRKCFATEQPCKNRSNFYLIDNKYFGMLCSECASILRKDKDVVKINEEEMIKIQFTFKILGD